ncbi:hypothetical protein CROQUDRAFT_92243 [Cronartium quercuum f. sp. fusiforme G11]|uniref:Uncharacterized protein n=1 Tax=Cronartium quercuum f. sp. fusiforme G11 TaxID=708437 RepID=A0A9P6NNI9_9BASI|nr:hypothetical protein CROQUDRAFT_92243 [Cronartium quercuum f. sp. fusiforme G11]
MFNFKKNCGQFQRNPTHVHELVMKIKKYLSENPGHSGNGMIMPDPHNSNQMFKLSHQALVIWA